MCVLPKIEEVFLHMNRDLLLKITRLINYVTAALILLLLITYALPYFTYPGGEKETISLWGYLGFPARFEQMEDLLGLKFVTIKQLNVTLGLLVTGIISIITLITKKGLATQLFPLAWGVWGILGYMQNAFLKLGNTFARPLHIVIILVELVVVVVNVVFYILELRARTDADYMDLDAWS